MATIKDVAKYAGVSVATVSRVLNKKEPLTEKTIKKVENAIEALGYYPNMYARTLVGGKNDTLGVILSSFNNPFFAELAQELERVAKEREYNILFTAAGGDFDEKMAATEYLLSRQVAGIIFSTYVDPDNEMKIRERCKVPFVNLLHPLSDTYSVYSDDRQGGILAARHLFAKGCKKVVHISAQTTVYKFADERTYTFVRECEKLGIDCKVYQNEYEVSNLTGIRELINRIFYENRDIDGMFLSNDILAAQCVAYALSQGYRIPDDIRIMGYDGIYITSLIYPTLTTVQQNFTKLAESAVDTVINLIQGKETPKEILVPVELIERKTT